VNVTNLSAQELEKVKKIELDILKATVKILSSHGIPYYLSFGTLIGAIRHKGFIPWDDDIDISLFRNDYEKARVILQEELPVEYIFCDRFSEKEYPYNFGKVRLKNSAFVHGGDSHLDINHGIYIDIFPLDDCPATMQDTISLFDKIKSLRKRSDLSMMSYRKYGRLRPLWQIPLILAAHLIVNPTKTRDEIDMLCKSGKSNSEYVCCYLTPYGATKNIFRRDWFGKGREVRFEDCSFLAPEKFHEYLTHIYGDYMALPPVEKRVSHHDVIYTSTDSAYHLANKSHG